MTAAQRIRWTGVRAARSLNCNLLSGLGADRRARTTPALGAFAQS